MSIQPSLAQPQSDDSTASEFENDNEEILGENVAIVNENLVDEFSTTGGNTDDPSPSTSDTYKELNLSHRGYDHIPQYYLDSNSSYSPTWVRSLLFNENSLLELPSTIGRFTHLRTLDLSNNGMANLSPTLGQLVHLRVLSLANNNIESSALPKSLIRLTHLEALNLGGNRLDQFPNVLTDLKKLKAVYLGGNRIAELPYAIGQMNRLEVLYMGGNSLAEIPATIGRLNRLVSLVLCDNKLETIPATIADCHSLQSLSLHNNRLTTLPPEIVKLRRLHQLSLRSNPLVARFVRDLQFDPPTLRELAGRSVKCNVPQPYDEYLPREMVAYLNSANRCVNPKCGGVYFDSCVEHVKFVDFCGKYRVPLLQYLCSPKCGREGVVSSGEITMTSSSSSVDTDTTDNEMDVDPQENRKIKRVLLG